MVKVYLKNAFKRIAPTVEVDLKVVKGKKYISGAAKYNASKLRLVPYSRTLVS